MRLAVRLADALLVALAVQSALRARRHLNVFGRTAGVGARTLHVLRAERLGRVAAHCVVAGELTLSGAAVVVPEAALCALCAAQHT